MFGNLQAALKAKTLLVLGFIHLGLILGVFSLARTSFPNGWDLTSTLFLVSIICLYGGFMAGLIFIVVPLLPWLKRAERMEHWTERLLREIPLLLEHLPQVIIALRSLIAVWNEAKTGERTTTSNTGE